MNYDTEQRLIAAGIVALLVALLYLIAVASIYVSGHVSGFWAFVVPKSLSDLFIDTEASLFIPFLVMIYGRGWAPRILGKMEIWLA